MSELLKVLTAIVTDIPVEVRVKVVACTAFLGLCTFIAWSVGAFPFLYSGFARQGALDQLQRSLLQTEASQAKDAILSLRQTECALPQSQSKAIYTATIATRMDEYYRITGRGFELPNCSDF